MAERDLLSIGTFALLSGLSVPTLRHYDEVGILEPAEVDRHTGYRRYQREQLALARTILALRAVDLPIDEVRAVLQAHDAAATAAILAVHRDRLAERGRELTRHVALVERYIEKGIRMQSITSFRPVAINVGVKDLRHAIAFYESVFGAPFEVEEADGKPVHARLRFGEGDSFFLFNLRERGAHEPHRDHTSAFGFAVEDLDAAHRRAVDAG